MSRRWATTGMFFVNGAVIGVWVSQIPWTQERFDLSKSTLGIVLVRKWKLPLSQTVVSGWMILMGWVPIAVLAPFFGPVLLHDVSGGAWFALVYNIVLAGTLAHWAFYRLARALPVAVSSMSSLPVPVVGVLSGMLMLGERPGLAEWVALLLVVAAMFAVLWTPRTAASPPPRDK